MTTTNNTWYRPNAGFRVTRKSLRVGRVVVDFNRVYASALKNETRFVNEISVMPQGVYLMNSGVNAVVGRWVVSKAFGNSIYETFAGLLELGYDEDEEWKLARRVIAFDLAENVRRYGENGAPAAV